MARGWMEPGFRGWGLQTRFWLTGIGDQGFGRAEAHAAGAGAGLFVESVRVCVCACVCVWGGQGIRLYYKRSGLAQHLKLTYHPRLPLH